MRCSQRTRARVAEQKKSAAAVHAVFAGFVACMVAAASLADWTGEISSSLWVLPSAGRATRWLQIHNLSDARDEGIYHVEVMERKDGDPVWKFKRLASHMAITESALRASIVKPLKTGSVYPESFNDSYREWKNAELAGHAFVCTSNVTACLAEVATESAAERPRRRQ
jgi:hypothetical protein